MITTLIIDQELENVIPPMSTAEMLLLEENILSDGKVIMPIVIWESTIIDGHKRFKIISKHPELPYTLMEMFFENKFQAIAWICRNQLGRRNLSEEYRKYLIGKRYAAEKMATGIYIGERKNNGCDGQMGQNDPPKKHGTRSIIADETNTSESYVKRADVYARGIDAAEKVLPGIKQEILTGTLQATAEEVMAIAKAPSDKIKEMAENLRLSKEEKQKKAKEKLIDIPTEEYVLDSMLGAVNQFMGVLGNYLARFPKLISEPEYLKRTKEILNTARECLSRLEGELD